MNIFYVKESIRRSNYDALHGTCYLFLGQQYKTRRCCEFMVLYATNVKLPFMQYTVLLTCPWNLFVTDGSIQNAKVQRTNVESLCIPYVLSISGIICIPIEPKIGRRLSKFSKIQYEILWESVMQLSIYFTSTDGKGDTYSNFRC
jgi:hypothetical protein